MAFLPKKKSFANFQQNRLKKAVYSDKEKRDYIPADVRRRVLSRFDGLCGYCGAKPKSLCVDHIHPYASTRDNREENLMPACRQCNNFKGIFTVEQFRRELELQVERGLKHSVNFRMALKYCQILDVSCPVVFYFEKVKNEKT
jgi:5-methylcytosine-specific restriction endonuclease McrA